MKIFNRLTEIKSCEICNRKFEALTKHHLIPRARAKKLEIKDGGELIQICRSCHNQLHAVIDHKALAGEFNTLKKILKHPEMEKYTHWVRSRKVSGKIKVRKPSK